MNLGSTIANVTLSQRVDLRAAALFLPGGNITYTPNAATSFRNVAEIGVRVGTRSVAVQLFCNGTLILTGAVFPRIMERIAHRIAARLRRAQGVLPPPRDGFAYVNFETVSAVPCPLMLYVATFRVVMMLCTTQLATTRLDLDAVVARLAPVLCAKRQTRINRDVVAFTLPFRGAEYRAVLFSTGRVQIWLRGSHEDLKVVDRAVQHALS